MMSKGIVMYGDGPDQKTESCHLSPNSEQPASGVPVVGPVWRHALWPKQLKQLVAAHNNIGFFIFPPISRSETDYDNLVELMISKDLAMSSSIGNIELIIFTSLELDDIQQTLGKYYLWGMIKGKGFRRRKQSDCKKATSTRMGASEYTKKTDIPPNSPLSRRNGSGSKHSKKSKKTVKEASLCSDKPSRKFKIKLKKTAPSAGAKQMTTLPFLGKCNLTPSPMQGCKKDRTRSKRRKLPPTVNKQGDSCKVIAADFPGKKRTDQPSNGLGDAFKVAQNCIVNETKEPDQHSWNSHMQIEETACRVSQNCIISETKEVEQHSWDSDMEIDEPTVSSLFNKHQEGNHMNGEETKHCSWDSDMEVDEPSESCGLNKQEEGASIPLNSTVDCLVNNVKVHECAVPQPHSEVTQEMDPEIETCLTPFRDSKQLPVAEVPNPTINVESNSCLNDKIVRNTVNANNQNNVKDTILQLNGGSAFHECAGVQPDCNASQEKDSSATTEVCNLSIGVERDRCSDDNRDRTFCSSMNANNHKNNVEDVIVKLREASTGDGLHHSSALENKLEVNATFIPIEGLEASSPRTQSIPECQTPLLDFEEQSGASTSFNATDATVILELSEEEEEEEVGTTIMETEIIRDGSEMITSSSMLKIADDFHETASESVRVQVGRYTIRSDLAPLVRKILDKHGDIASECSLMPEVLLEDISKALQGLESVPVSGLRYHHLNCLRNLCQLGEAVGVDVKWLSTRCEELEKMALQLIQYLVLKNEKAQCNKTVQSLEEKLNIKRATAAKLLEKNNSIVQELESLKECQEKLHCEVEHVRSSARRFQGKSLADQLFEV